MKVSQLVLFGIAVFSFSACDVVRLNGYSDKMSATEEVSKESGLCSGPSSDPLMVQYANDMSLRAALNELNGAIQQRGLWGAFVITEEMVFDSVIRVSNDISREFRQDFDRILRGEFPVSASLVVYEGPYWDSTHHRCSERAFFVRLNVTHLSQDGSGSGYAVGVGRDVAENEQGLPEAMPAPTPTPQPSQSPKALAKTLE